MENQMNLSAAKKKKTKTPYTHTEDGKNPHKRPVFLLLHNFTLKMVWFLSGFDTL